MKPIITRSAWLMVLCFFCTIAASNAWTVSISKSNVLCFGASTGSATANINGSAFVSAFASYQWSNGANTKTITNLTAGTYTVTVTSLGTVKIATTTITQPTNIVGSVYSGNTCLNLCNGYIYVAVSGGTPPYTRMWSNGSTGTLLTNLCAGNYWLTVTDANGCMKIIGATVNTAPIAVNVVTTPVGCSTLGAAMATASGAAPFYYYWSNGATTSTISNLNVGSYTVTVYNSAGCSASAVANIGTAAPLTVTQNVSNLQCSGTCTGAITLATTGGVPPYVYQWGDGPVTSSRIGLCAGAYTVTAYDASGCSTSATATVTVTPMTASINTTNATCTGGGSAGAVVTGGGTGPFTFLWSTGAQTPSINNLSPGTYGLTVTNLNTGCTATATGVVGGASLMSIAVSHTNVSCYGACNGTAAVAVVGGTMPYSYLWSSGGTTSAAANLCPGFYSVTVTDASGCSIAAVVTITTPSAMAITTTSTNTTCVNTATGTAAVLVIGGFPPYSYAWSNGATSAFVSNLAAGEYCVTVTDDNNCNVSACEVIDENGDPFVPSDSYVAPGCDDDCEGFIQLVFMGGEGPYSYQWNNGSTAGVLLDVCEGIYTVTASDANGCTLSETFEVINYDCGGPEITLTATNPSCGNCNGSIVATVSGGSPSYFYIWNVPDSTNQLTNLCAGTYTVTVIDGNGNTGQKSVTLTNGGLNVTATASAVCPGECNGMVAATALGVSSFVFQWSNGATTSYQNNLCPGTYEVIVTSFDGCTGSAIAVVQTGVSVQTVGDTVCLTACNGGISASASGGNAPYSYMWTDEGDTAPTRTNVCAGAYGVVVTDNMGCTTSGIANVVPTIIPQDFLYFPSACNECNGWASAIIPTNGSLLWSTSATTSTINNLCPGTYSLTATAYNGCTNIINFDIEESDIVIALTPTVSSPNCNGTLTATASGGTAPYYFTVGTDTFDQTLSGLCPGSYFVVATDANGCTAWQTFTIGIPGTFYAYAVATNTCISSCVGIITSTANGGFPPYTFEWSNGATTQNLTNACDGNYIVTVTDSDGATTAAFVIVGSQQDPNIIMTTTMASCDSCDGAISIIVQGGAVGYSWDNGLTTASITDLCGGEYNVTVVNSIGCTASATGIVNHNCRTAEDEIVFENAGLYPNPTDGNTTLSFTSTIEQSYRIALVDVTGKTIVEKFGVAVIGTNAVAIDMNGYANGIYFLHLQSDHDKRTFKVVKD